MNYQTLNEALARELNEERMKSQELTRLVQEHTDHYNEMEIEHRRVKYLYEKSCQETSRHVSAAVRAAKVNTQVLGQI
jgi:flagellar biosynthesis chaperone FliJ